jgi:hypothetical protein
MPFVPLILGDVIWPALVLEARLLSVWIILAGLVIEYFFVWRMTSLGAVRSIWANLAMNAASCLLGIVLLPFTGFLMSAFTESLFGTFSPIGWTLTFLLAVFVNTSVEFLVLDKAFRQDLGKRHFWLLLLANALSVGFAFVSFFIYPITV